MYKNGLKEPNKQSSSTNTPAESPIQASTDTPISLKVDNQGSIILAHNPVYFAQIKYIDIQYHSISDKLAAGQINLQYIQTCEIITDGLIKALTHTKFHSFVK